MHLKEFMQPTSIAWRCLMSSLSPLVMGGDKMPLKFKFDHDLSDDQRWFSTALPVFLPRCGQFSCVTFCDLAGVTSLSVRTFDERFVKTLLLTAPFGSGQSMTLSFTGLQRSDCSV